MGSHLSLIAVQVVGSVWIQKLSPDWSKEVREDEVRQ
jgi:hypothetical protein